MAETLQLVDFADEAALRRAVVETARRHDVTHVLHFGAERTQLAVCQEAATLGLEVNAPSSLVQINDKAAMRRLLHELGISPVASIEVASPRTAQRMVDDGLELPVVIKPTGLDGSRAVRLIERPSDLRGWVGELTAHGYRGPVLIEQVLRGPEFSVETLTAGGRHHVVGITAKRLGPAPGFVEMGHVHPGSLAAADRAAIVDMTLALLDAAGYRFGPAHTELILTADGPRIVESQTRLGGDRIPLLIEIACGFDVEAALFASLAGEIVEPPPAQRLGCVSFFDFGTGRVDAVAGEDAIRRLPYVHALKLKVGRGDDLAAVIDSPSRHGHVVLEAGDEQEANERLGVVRELLRVTTGHDAEAAATARRPPGTPQPQACAS